MTDVATKPSTSAAFNAPIPRRTRRPGWLDFRLIFGVILVLGAVLTGSVILQSADHRHPVWQLSRSLPAGAVLRGADLRVAMVQLGGAAGAYLSSNDAVIGMALRQDVAAGELLTRAELAKAPSGVTVTVPVKRENAPSVQRGDRITVWVTTKTCRAVVVVSGTDVQSVSDAGGSGLGSGGGLSIVLTLPGSQADRVVSALDFDSAVIRVGVLAAGQAATAAEPDLAACGGAAG